MSKTTVGILIIAGILATALVGIYGTELVQKAYAQSASSTGAATDFGSATSSAAGNVLTGGSSSSSCAGTNATSDAGGNIFARSAASCTR